MTEHTIEPEYMQLEGAMKVDEAFYNSDEPVFCGYSRPLLLAAFHSVSDPDDWKAEIDGVVESQNVTIVCAAIGFFTAADVTVTPRIDGTYRVTSVGYRMGPAGP